MTRNTTFTLGVVDDDPAFLLGLGKRLEEARWDHIPLNGSESVRDLTALKLNALLVDPAALESDPWEYLKAICGELPALALLVCSADSTLEERVRALRLGVDDWIAKPSHPREVIARIEATVRRTQPGPSRLESAPMLAGELEIRADQYQVLVAGESVGLTRREFEVLHLLAGVSGQVIEREEIYRQVWGYAMAHGDRSVDVFVRKLRLKLESHSAGWRYIHTHVGVGYRFEPDPADEAVEAAEPRSQTVHSSVTAA